MKRTMSWTALLLAALLASAPAFAFEGQAQCGAYGRHGEFSRDGVSGKLFMKAGLLLKHKADLALTDDQVKAIEAIKLEATKNAVRSQADARIRKLDLMSKLHEETIDVKGASALIDEGAASYAAAQKADLEAYAKLKGLLTPEQAAKLKEIRAKRESEKHAHERA